MNILVTGGAGFIGAHLARRLKSDGHHVVIVDNCSTKFPELHTLRITELVSDISLQQVDITDAVALEAVFAETVFDMVYHLAARPGVRQSLESPGEYARVNYEGTVNVCECARKHNIKNIVVASSSSVYGQSNQLPFTEAQLADEPISIYAATKRAVELLAFTYCSLYAMNITALRFFTVYGPYGRPDMAPWIFTEKIKNNEPIAVYDGGNHRRDFTYISDIVDGCTALVGAVRPGYHCYNLGQGKTIELLDFITVIETLLHTESQKNFLSAQPGDVNNTYANTERAAAHFSFAPKVSIENGMKQFVDWFVTYQQ